jgi:nucleoside-diphosphate-sugar epimerase
MRIVVTGSSGRVGMGVLRELLEQGHDVVPVDLRPPKQALPELPATRLLNLADVSEAGANLDEIVTSADAVCHLGNVPGFDGTSNHAPAALVNNVGSTFNIFHAASAAGVRKLVYASSIQAYGILTNSGDNSIVSPPRYLPIDEDHPLLPRDGYPLSKALGEHVTESFARRDARISAFSLRLSWVVSPAHAHSVPQDPSWSPRPTASLYSYVHVRDVARAIRLCLESDRTGHIPLNIVSPRSGWAWSADALREAYGVEPVFRQPLAPQDSLFSTARAWDMIGFRAERSQASQ